MSFFSAGLYSSPNKAFEELICNSYDAFADIVSVFVSPDLTNENAYIMVCDNGEGLTQDEFKDLWKIGESSKRDAPERDARRLQIGQFGIGKLSTYILARSLTHVSKKAGRYIMTTMDYNEIHTDTKTIKLPEIELTESEANDILMPFIFADGKSLVEFPIFGEKAVPSWTVSLLTDLKPKAAEIQIGRLKWILSTALPLNPSFVLFLNNIKIESSKTKIPIIKEWIIGKDDQTALELDFTSPHEAAEANACYVDFEKLNHVTGKFVLYEQSLLGGKASDNGRSHGIFLTIRGRLINLDDPLLGMEPFSHGPFNHCQIIIQADGLDSYLTSTRESVKESIPLAQLKEYIKKKFNNEVRKYYFDIETEEQKRKTIAYRLAQTSYSASQKPIKSFIQRFYDGSIVNPILIQKPSAKNINELLSKYEKEADGAINSIEHVDWGIVDTNAPIASLCLDTKTLTINSLHPFVANYSDSFKNTLPLENIIITEVLSEAYMYELGIEESNINAVIRRRDLTLRQLAYSDNDGIPAVAQLLRDSLSNATELETAVYRALIALGFETVKVGGNGKPDGFATAQLGHNTDGSPKSYSLTYDAKSTAGVRIAAGTAKLSGLKRHQTAYHADYCLEVAVGYEGEDDPDSAISKESSQQRVTVMKAKDLAQLLLYSIPKQLGLSHLEDLFKNCHTPLEVSAWVNDFVNSNPEKGPYHALIDTVYKFQKDDTEPPTVEVIRLRINEELKAKYSTGQIKTYLESLKNIIPGQFHFDGVYAFVDATPDIVKSHISQAITNSVPFAIQDIYKAMFQ